MSKAASSTIIWVFGITQPGTEPRCPGSLTNILTIISSDLLSYLRAAEENMNKMLFYNLWGSQFWFFFFFTCTFRSMFLSSKLLGWGIAIIAHVFHGIVFRCLFRSSSFFESIHSLGFLPCKTPKSKRIWILVLSRAYSFIYLFTVQFSELLWELYRPIVLVGRVFANGSGDRNTIPGQVIPKTKKVVLDVALLNTQNYKVRIKWRNPGNGVAPSPLPWCSS